jgi:hypothetical protein
MEKSDLLSLVPLLHSLLHGLDSSLSPWYVHGVHGEFFQFLEISCKSIRDRGNVCGMDEVLYGFTLFWVRSVGNSPTLCGDGGISWFIWLRVQPPNRLAESRLEGVNRAKLKFTNFKHNYKSGLALEI